VADITAALYGTTGLVTTNPGIKNVIILGGNAAVPAAVETELNTAFGKWAFEKSGVKQAYTLVADYGPGLDKRKELPGTRTKITEEMREITTSFGTEYWYNNTFAGRLGYFYESKDKGSRQYLTAGVGFRFDKYGLDVAYIVPTNKKENALAETLRFTLVMMFDKKVKEDDSVTDQ